MKINLEYNNSEDQWEGQRLRFKKYSDQRYTIVNNDKELLGYIELIRVGAWMHWCILLEEGCYLSPGCTDEAREMQRILGGMKNKSKKEEN